MSVLQFNLMHLAQILLIFHAYHWSETLLGIAEGVFSVSQAYCNRKGSGRMIGRRKGGARVHASTSGEQ